jgi:ubiquinone/menaquinone biosynthesis C-methylase UbiE
MDTYREFRNDTLREILTAAFGQRELRILEVGCGTGLSLDFLARVSDRYSLFGMDASDTMLRQAAEKAAVHRHRPMLTLGDAGKLPFASGAFDVVFATRFIHQFPHETKRRLWQEFQRVLRPGGSTILEFYARPYHLLRYYFGARKGRSAETYFRHYPSRAEVLDIVGGPLQIHPLRLPGARLASALGDSLLRRATRFVGRLGGGLLLDEYFVVASKR